MARRERRWLLWESRSVRRSWIRPQQARMLMSARRWAEAELVGLVSKASQASTELEVNHD